MRKRRQLTTALALAVFMAIFTASPAFAAQTPLKSATASGYGAAITLLNAQVLPPTPPGVTAGPGVNTGSNNLLTVPLSTVVSAGAASAKAQTTLNSTIQPEIPTGNRRVVGPAGAPMPTAFNAQGFGRVAGAAVLASDIAGLPPEVAVIADLLPALIGADLVESEALISCVDNKPVIVAGARTVGLTVLGTSLSDPLNNTVNQVVDLVSPLLATLTAKVTQNQQIVTATGVTVNAVRVEIPLLGVDVTLGHSEVNGPAGGTCEAPPPDCRDGIDNDGDRLIDFNPPPGAQRDPGCSDENDDSEENILPRTGGNGPGLGIALLAGGGALMLATLRKRRSAGPIS